MSKCHVKRINATDLWTQLTTTNKWLFVARKPLTIDIICDGQIFSQKLENSGYIQFNQQCTIEREEFVLRTAKTVVSHLNASFTPQFNISYELNDSTNLLQFNKFNYNNNPDLQILDNEINNLRNVDKTVTKHHIHHYSISCGIVICIIGIFIYLKYKLRVRLPRLNPRPIEVIELTGIPTPAQRAQPVNTNG